MTKSEAAAATQAQPKITISVQAPEGPSFTELTESKAQPEAHETEAPTAPVQLPAETTSPVAAATTTHTAATAMTLTTAVKRQLCRLSLQI